jgi:hypothetical protein
MLLSLPISPAPKADIASGFVREQVLQRATNVRERGHGVLVEASTANHWLRTASTPSSKPDAGSESTPPPEQPRRTPGRPRRLRRPGLADAGRGRPSRRALPWPRRAQRRRRRPRARTEDETRHGPARRHRRLRRAGDRRAPAAQAANQSMEACRARARRRRRQPPPSVRGRRCVARRDGPRRQSCASPWPRRASLHAEADDSSRQPRRDWRRASSLTPTTPSDAPIAPTSRFGFPRGGKERDPADTYHSRRRDG